MNWITWPHSGGSRSGRESGLKAGSWLDAAQEFLISVFDQIGEWQERSAQRHRLMTMDARMLHDVGLCREDAINEAQKPFWKA